MATNMPRVEKGYGLHNHEIEKRIAPGGHMPIAPIKGAKVDPRGEAKGQVIADGSPNAMAAAAERHDVRHKPALAASRMAGAPPSSKR